MKVLSVGNEHIGTGTDCQPGCGQLGSHAAGTYLTAAGILPHFQKLVIQLMNLINKRCIRIRMGIIGETARQYPKAGSEDPHPQEPSRSQKAVSLSPNFIS